MCPHVNGNGPENVPQQIRENMRRCFRDQWDTERMSNRKLSFYNSIKKKFECELYLGIHLSHNESKKIAQLRTSSHRFNIETGRHGTTKCGRVTHRLCYTCSTDDVEVLECLAEMPLFEPILEDEIHVLRTCPLYEDFRHRLSQPAKTWLFADPAQLFTDGKLIREVSKFLVRADSRRFPVKKSESKGRGSDLPNNVENISGA